MKSQELDKDCCQRVGNSWSRNKAHVEKCKQSVKQGVGECTGHHLLLLGFLSLSSLAL